MSICSLRIDPEEIAVPAGRDAQRAHYAVVRRRLDKTAHVVMGPDQSEHVSTWRDRTDGKWLRVNFLSATGWPSTCPGWGAGKLISVQDPECGDEFRQPRRVLVRDIIATVADYYEIRAYDLLSQRRTRPLIIPRQIAMYFARELTPKSLPEIGGYFGGRDHTTVLHAARKIERLIKLNPELAESVVALRMQLTGDAA
ncbi:hypothetical protein QOZ94_002773 [Xanthobacter agilis]|uniref:Chromosomal replication initiator DnaA C-terminal domain-containing protein n=1 Tax=Xanthobacter agilis TaxID=47492 RepID=A0ABU0LFP7_XANAG|nr:helix-turn-helix domain-containing protein [Xanthobacter agilis]MDQ0505969.1 hypothetical protein [Xanthobacter agilis]